MLIRFSLENWMSFKNRVSFSMIASRELQHKERLPELPKIQNEVLPIAAIYEETHR
jgi:AAA15 family ATPase/GTPase